MARDHNYYVYFMASSTGVLYVGMTNDLARRAFEHRHRLHEGFTKRYWCTRLVYFEHYTDVLQTIAREKELKRWRREKKLALIRGVNPSMDDLSLGWE